MVRQPLLLQRIADTAPKALRQQMREETEKARATL